MSTDDVEVTERTRLRRIKERGHFDRATIYGILDVMPLCHVGYVFEGEPAVTPTIQWREGDTVYWHGSAASRALRAAEGMNVCLTVSLLDGLVLARSAFHHSANYRSVMIFGRATKVEDPAEKTERLKGLVEGLYPGRWDLLRPIKEQEVKATTVLALPITEASAKVRTGGPIDDEEDYVLPIWAGVIPVSHTVRAPIPDPRNLEGVAAPGHVGQVDVG